ncbi:unnamed protein product [marine sediment metagenome]|uniref:Uncharacterized protein n=1 Tax=marine sediment metagenome TaxID=412755 RepID=X0ZW31_9ZZZZ
MQIKKEDFEERLRQLALDINKIIRELPKEIYTDERIATMKEIKHAIVLRFMDILGGDYIGNG